MRLPPNESDPEGPSLTPVIDVVFLLLIFFLVATRLNEDEREISTRLAEVSQARPLSMPAEEVVINVTDRGQYVIVGETLGEEALANFLHEAAVNNRGRQTVQIRTDERAAFRYPARVMGLCEREGLGHYCTVVERPQ